MIEKILFSRAIEKPHKERAAFVRAICAGCTELCDSIEELIAAHEESKRGSQVHGEFKA
jgi:hypothetical protein